MKYILLFVMFFLSFGYLEAQQTITNRMVHDGLDRDYHIYIPESYDETINVPILFVFHGYGGNARKNPYGRHHKDATGDEKNLQEIYHWVVERSRSNLIPK